MTDVRHAERMVALWQERARRWPKGRRRRWAERCVRLWQRERLERLAGVYARGGWSW
jgi:hypothetical protein